MRCKYSLCQSNDTKLIERKVNLFIAGDTILDYVIDEIWLCNNCGNPFSPVVQQYRPFDYRKRSKREFISRTLGGLNFAKITKDKVKG